MNRRLISLTVAIALLASLPVVGLSAASPAVSSSAAGNYSLGELRQGGEAIAGAAPSTRWISGGESIFVDYEHSNPLRKQRGDEWKAKQLLSGGSTVRTNEIRIHSRGTPQTGDRNHTIKIVYYDVGSRTTTVNNETVTEQFAKNVSVETHHVSFSEPFSRSTIRLQPHYDSPKQATMWVVGHQDSARWRFTHHSVETSQAVDISTIGDLLWWLFVNVLLKIILGSFAVFTIVPAMKRFAGEGPQKGIVWWLIVVSLVTGIALAAAYTSIAEMLANGSTIISLLTVAVIAIPVLEARRDVSKWLFVRPQLTEATTATGDEAKDATRFELDERRITRMPNGRLAVVESGIMKFLARLFGGAAYLTGQDHVDTEVRASGDSRFEQLVFTKASADAALEYDPEGWGIEWPSVKGLIPLGLTAYALGAIGSAHFGTWTLAAAAVPLMVVRPHAGTARVDPADGHQRAAYVSMLWAIIEDEHAETLAETRKELMQTKAHNQKQVKKAIEQDDDTIIREFMSEGIPDEVQGPSVEQAVDGARENGDTPDDGGELDTVEKVEKLFRRIDGR